MRKNDGNRPVYPTSFEIEDMSHIPPGQAGIPRTVTVSTSGITLREHFSGLALQGLVASLMDNTVREFAIENASANGLTPKQQIAKAAVEYADALIAELSL